MPIRAFQVGPARGLRLAAFADLPNVVVICGPNGAGKSTLLRQLYERRAEFAEPGGEVLFLGPHRPWRKSTLTAASMYQAPRSYAELLGMDSLPGWDQVTPSGLENVGGRQRLPESADEAQSLVKYTIARSGFKRLNAIGDAFDRGGGEVPRGAVPEMWGPLRDLTRYLLPHLEFERVDLANDRDIRVLFRRIDGDQEAELDLDELSSGEKAVVALFLPFIESQMTRVLIPDTPVPAIPPTALFDEPDLHLHPTLQVSLLDYVRQIADRGEAQFILATHSPTILDAARDDELFLLAPVGTVADGNQFLRVSGSSERLEALRDLTGSTHLVTRCRPIVFVEGERTSASSGVTDQRLLEMILPVAASWVTVPSRGRAEAIRSANQLREVALTDLPGIAVFALVDADQHTAGDPDWAIAWPVAMIENLLLDPVAIWQVLEPHRERTGLQSVDDIRTALLGIANRLRDDEVRVRVRETLGPIRLPVEPIDEADVARYLADLPRALAVEVAKLGGEQGVRDAVQHARETVDNIVADGRQLAAFRGKPILKGFFNDHTKKATFGYSSFVYALADAARRIGTADALAAGPVAKIRFFVPSEIVAAVRGLEAELEPGAEKNETARVRNVLETARAEWTVGDVPSVDRRTVRADLVRAARLARAHGLDATHAAITRLVVELGVG